jgi:hypothetical protein
LLHRVLQHFSDSRIGMKLKEYLYGCIFFLGLAYIYYMFKEIDGFQNNMPIFGVLCIFKNEEMVIREWIEHYLWQGADYIILLNNGSTDNFREQLDGFDERVIVIDAPEQHAQIKNYNSFGLPEVKKRNISMLAVVDVDEFLFSKDGSSLKSSLMRIFSENPGVSQLSVNWTMFGSNDYNKQPNSVRLSFTKRAKDLHPNVKSILLVKEINSIDIHSHNMNGNTKNISDTIQLNHYAIQSKEYFEKVKMSRGAVDRTDNVRNWEYFHRYDHKDEDDFLLRDYVANI